MKGKLSPVVLRAAPYGGGALVVCVLGSSAGLGLELGSYGAAFALLVAVGLLLPLWGAGAPGGLRLVPVLVFLLAVALLRHAGGGAGTGVAALILLPVLWVALHGSRRELAVVVVGVAAFFVVPFVLVGPPIYPVSPWRTALFASAVAGIAGLLVQRLVGQVREQVRRALQRQRDVEVLLHLMHEIAGAVDVRRAVCEAALVVSGAPACVLLECGGQQRLVATAAAGASGESLVLEPPEGPVARALATGRGELVSAAGGGQVDHALLAALGEPAWVAVEPVVGRGVTGVLVVSWGQAVERSREALALLAAEAASAIARADLLAELESLARIDPLTGLPNRRAWDEALASAVARSDRDGRPLSVAVLDIDTFKTFNDVHGHQAGDRLLTQAAAAWREELRGGDVLARWGGDEFAVLLMNTPLMAATETGQRLRAAVPHQSCSAGVAEWDGREDIQSLLARADAELYACKATNRQHGPAT